MDIKTVYKGDLYVYKPEVEIEPQENEKIYHEVYVQERNIQGDKVGPLLYICNMPMSPYSHIGANTFEMWVECGMPNKKELNLGGNARNQDIKDYYDKWLDDKIDEAILGRCLR